MPILVIRFSALGDVALTIPVFKTLEHQLPNQKFYFLTRSIFKDLFLECKNVTVIPVDLEKDYKGITGLKSLASYLMTYKFNKVIDLHDVLRTKVLRSLLQLNEKEIVVFKKGRKEKKDALKNLTKLKDLPHTTKRYLNAFNSLDITGSLTQGPWLDFSIVSSLPKEIEEFEMPQFPKKWIGIAPFSKHNSKEWSIKKIKELISTIDESYDAQIFLFAFGNSEKRKAKSILNQFKNISLIDESSTLSEQLFIIKKLDIMVSMDSGNMHLASILGINVVSIWISTHPKIGFSPLGNEKLVVLPNDDKSWKPLSIYGKVNKKDLNKVEEAKSNITVEDVFNKLKKVLNQKV